MFIITPILHIKKRRYKFKSLIEGDTENKALEAEWESSRKIMKLPRLCNEMLMFYLTSRVRE